MGKLTKKLAGIVDPEPEVEKSVDAVIEEGREFLNRRRWARALEVKPSDIKGGSNVPRHFFTETPDGTGTMRWEEAVSGRLYANHYLKEVDGVLYVAKR